MTQGRCALCRRDGILEESHLLPRALYKNLRDAKKKKPEPVLFSIQSSKQTESQAKRRLLCAECEGKFSKEGEDWTLSNYCRSEGKFPLRDLLRPHTAQRFTETLHCYYCDGIPAIDSGALSYFALSVVWRNAVCSWMIDGIQVDRLGLGPYEEAMRAIFHNPRKPLFYTTVADETVLTRFGQLHRHLMYRDAVS